MIYKKSDLNSLFYNNGKCAVKDIREGKKKDSPCLGEALARLVMATYLKEK